MADNQTERTVFNEENKTDIIIYKKLIKIDDCCKLHVSTSVSYIPTAEISRALGNERY